jgi:hypothetical protein
MQDRNGVSLNRDDEVTIKGKVLGFSGEGSRHVVVQTEDQSRITVNVNQVEKTADAVYPEPAKIAANEATPVNQQPGADDTQDEAAEKATA